MKRPSGTYRVKDDNGWTIAQYHSPADTWLVPGSESEFSDDDWQEIEQEPIQMPDAAVTPLGSTKVPNMDQQQMLHQLNGHLQGLYADLGIPHQFTERVESIDPRDDMIHLTFTHGEEDHADQLIRAARRSFASFGPEYWLPDNHPGAAQFRHTEHMQFKVRKSLIVSHLYWGVSFILCGPDEGYSLVEDTQP